MDCEGHDVSIHQLSVHFNAKKLELWRQKQTKSTFSTLKIKLGFLYENMIEKKIESLCAGSSFGVNCTIKLFLFVCFAFFIPMFPVFAISLECCCHMAATN